MHRPEAVGVIVPHVGSELKPAESSIKAPVGVLLMGASMRMSASNVENPIANLSAILPPESNSRPFRDLKYRHHLLWDANEVGHDSLSPCVRDTFFADPVPQPSDIEWSNVTARSTLCSRPYLFKVVTPINVDRFETLLVDHLNQAFVQSVCYALHNGFWPWAETVKDEYPTTSDHPNRPPQSDHHLNFIAMQFREEEACSRFSPLFGHDLLPGMYSVPVHAVPKPRSEKLRMVVDHSAGSPSLNDMIDRDVIAGTKMDGMCSLNASLLEFREKNPHTKLVIFKSNMSMAYRRMPMHPLWQLKQIVTHPDGNHHVNRCNNFGGKGSCKVWVSFMSLVTWIAIYVKLLTHLKVYMDDSYSFERADNMKFYAPYNKSYPAKQTNLLLLWDEIRLPHDEPKQLFGDTLEVIGLVVDPNSMSVLFPDEKHKELLAHIHTFAVVRKRWPLREFLRIAGWCNWVFNMFFLLPPGLSALYEKVAGKSNMFAGVAVNAPIVRELTWLAHHLQHLPGIRLFNARAWTPSDDDVTVAFTDATSTSGLGIFFPDLELGFQCPSSELPTDSHINYLELLAVVSALHICSLKDNVPKRLAVFSDSSFAVDVFSSLRARPPFNHLLMFAVDILISHSIDLRVVHVAGENNGVADALSRFHNEDVRALVPQISILHFIPPRDALGVNPQ